MASEERLTGADSFCHTKSDPNRKIKFTSIWKSSNAIISILKMRAPRLKIHTHGDLPNSTFKGPISTHFGIVVRLTKRTMLAVRASLPSSGLRASQVGAGASSSRSFGSRALCNVAASKVASSSSVGGSKLVSGRYSKVSRTLSAKYAQKSQTKFQNLSTRSYSTTAPHPAQDASDAPVSVLDTLTKEYPVSSMTQESMLLKLEDLVPLPNTFAVVQVGGHQVRP